MNTKKSICSASHQNRKTLPISLFFFLLIMVCLVIADSKAVAATYYLDAVKGNDNNPGTREQPWKTLSRAQLAMAEKPGHGSGDTVIIHEANGVSYGNYVCEPPLERSDYLTWKAAEGEKPLFSAIQIQKAGAGTIDTRLIFDGITVSPGLPKFGVGLQGVYLQNVAHVKLLNMTFTGTGYVHGSKSAAIYLCANDIEINNCIIKGDAAWAGRNYETGFEFGVYGRNTNNVTITNCDMTACEKGIHAWGRNWNIINNVIHDVDADGIILMYAADVLIENNHIYNIYPPIFITAVGASYSELVNSKGIITAAAGTPYGSEDLAELWVRVTADSNYIESPVRESAWLKIESSTGNTITLADTYALGREYQNITKVEVKRGYHCDAIQLQDMKSYPGDYVEMRNIIISRNRLHNSDRQGMHIWPYDWVHGITLENNLVYNCNARDVQLGRCRNVIFRNNTVIGECEFRADTTIDTITGNILGSTTFFKDMNSIPVREDYNIVLYWGSPIQMPVNFISGKHSISLNQNQKAFAALFADYANEDFRHASSSSPGVGYVDPADATLTDICGKSRDSHPDAGCYEYILPLSFKPIGDKEVNEGVTLTFTIDVNDANIEPFIEEHNLPSEPNFSNKIFNWTPSYDDAGSYETIFAAQTNSFEDSEIVDIHVNNVNRSPVFEAIGNKSVNEDSTLSFAINATDPDKDSITYSAENLPQGAMLSGQNFSWKPGYNQAGTYRVKFVADDGQTQDTQFVNLTVNDTSRFLIFEKFNNGTFTDWSIIDEGIRAGPSSWSAASGALVQSSNIHTLSYPSQPGTYALYNKYDPKNPWTNYMILATMESGTDGSIGIMFRYQDKNNYYRFLWDNSRRLHKIEKKCNGQFSLLCRKPVLYNAGRRNQLRIIVCDTTFLVFINDNLVLKAKDSCISSGGIALYSWANSQSSFDNIIAHRL